MDPLWLVLLTSSIPSPLDRSKMTTHLGHEQIDFTAMHGMEF